MTTARDIIRAAIEGLGEYSPGEDMDAADADRGLRTLNNILADWSNQNLACFAMLQQSFALVNGQSAYTIGPLAADITSARPLRIEQAWSIDGQSTKVPIEIISPARFVVLEPNSGTPTRLYYDAQVPLGIIKLWPTPNAATSIGFLSYLQFTQFTNLTDEVVLPTGYAGALENNLAVALAPFFNRPPPAVTVALATEYKGTLKTKNIINEVASFDGAILGGQGVGRNIYADGE